MLKENSNLKISNKNKTDYAFCMNCDCFIGFFDKINDKKYEFLNLILNSVVIEDEEHNYCQINLIKYFKYRIVKNLSENLNKLYLINSGEIFNSKSLRKEENLFLEITKNVINISTTITCKLNDNNNQAKMIYFDNSNIKRFLLFYLINSSLSNNNNNTQKKDQNLFNFDDDLYLLHEKSLLFINSLEQEVKF